jgi:transcriptional regulator with XRE-family HTH domain
MTDTEHLSKQNERLKELLNELGVNGVELSKKVHLSQSFISLMTSGKNELSKNFLLRLSLAYPHVDTGWLLTGRGEMFLRKNLEAAERADEAPNRNAPPIAINIKRIRDRWDMGQTHFGDLLGASRNQVSHWERGRTEPDWESLQQLEALSGIPQSTLRTLELTNDEIPARPGSRATLENQMTLKEINDRLGRIEEMLSLFLEQKTSGS